MNYHPESAPQDFYAADAAVDTRMAFLRRVYAHVFAAVLGLVAISAVILKSGVMESMLPQMMDMWWLALLAFMAVSWIAQKMAYSGASTGTQYAGLGLYVLAEAVIFAPMLYVVNNVIQQPELFAQAGFLTLLIFAGLTAVVFFTKADFSFLRGVVVVGGLLALGLIFGGMIFGFNLGLWFSVAIVGLMAVTILYQTSEIYHNFPPTMHVAAALALFSSIATLFYYILRILIALSDD